MNHLENSAKVLSPDRSYVCEALPGQTVRDVLRQLPEWYDHSSLAVFNHGHRIKDYDGFVVNPGDNLLICLVPEGGGGGGGKGILSVVAAVAIIAVAWWNPMGWAASGALLSQATLYAVGGSLLLGGVGTMLAPKPQLGTANSLGTSQRENSYFLTGQSNGARPYSPVLVCYGKNKIYPALAANPNIVNVGKDSTIDALYDFGIGLQSYNPNDIKFGGTPASQYYPQYYYHFNTKTPELKLITNRYAYQDFAVLLEPGSPFIARTEDETINAEVNIAFSRGLAFIDNNGATQPSAVTFRVEWSPAGANSWSPVAADSFKGATVTQVSPTEVSVSAATLAPFVLIAAVVFPGPGLYDIRVHRTSVISTDARRQDEATFTLLESRVVGNVLNLAAPHTMLEMRVKASERLNGVVQNLSVISTSALNTYGANGNVILRTATRNPAWIAIDILTGPGNPRPIRNDQIDWPAWKRLADICDTPRTWTIGKKVITSARFTCDVVVDYKTTVKELLESVLSTCRASLTIGVNGKYSVMFDGERTIPRQIITPSNSRNFTAARQFPPEVHALKVSFIDAQSDYQKQETVVYADGYNASNAEIFEDVGTFGITEYQHAWAFGRYQLASAIGRAEVFTVTMDIENLACQRGDLVHVAHDVPMVGGVPAFVISVNGNTVDVTESLGILPNSYTVRLSDGTIRQGTITQTVDGNSFTLDNASGIQPDDLIVIGEAERVVKPYIVSQISPSLDLSATLTLLPYVKEIYDADIGDLPEWAPEISNDLINASNLEITSVNVDGQKMVYVDRMPYGKFIVTWEVNQPSLVNSYNLVITTADGERQVITGLANKYYEYSIDLVQNPLKYGPIVFDVTPFTAGGIPGKPGSATNSIVPDRIAPAKVNWFLVNVQDMDIAISWEPPKEPDILEYEVRYSPRTFGANWNASQIIGRFAHNVTRTMIGARTGSYGIIVRDTSGNVSELDGRRTTIEYLPNINLIKRVNDAPEWAGQLENVEREGYSIQSAGDWGSVTPEGFYYYKEYFDAGEIYELRISNKIESHGATFDDYIVNWVPLAIARPLVSSQSSLYNCMLEVRTSDDVPFITALSAGKVQLPMDEGGIEWSPWRPCEVGDFTGRLFQFRVRMQSFNPYVKAVLDDGLIEIDVRDRIDRFSDLPVPVEGLDVEFDPPFMEPPTLAVTTENSTAVTHTITNKTRFGFNVQLFDELKKPVVGQVDVLALGYGRQRPAKI
jgi:predicted phage tail protein